MSTGRIISSSAAFVVLVCFFLPWISVSCSEQEIATLSGYDLVAGTDIDLGVGTEEVEPDLIFLAVPLAALVVLGLVLISALDVFPGSLVAAGQVAASSIGLLVLAFKWLEARSDSSDVSFVSFSPEIGVWGVVIGLIAIIIGAILSLFEEAVSKRIDPEET
jgi:multisubunit Na+/H+ antiporter MnhB subunit